MNVLLRFLSCVILIYFMQALCHYDVAIANNVHDESALLNRAITKVNNRLLKQIFFSFSLCVLCMSNVASRKSMIRQNDI